ncbi:glycosyltransferase [bacterium]|nr:glycosyltransferase [bacterium]
MKSSLHICNLANVAYSNCKILKEFGSDVRLVTHDIGHVMSQPEWQDLNLDPASFEDEWDFYGSWEKASVEADGYFRPDWYQDTCLHQVGVVAKRRGIKGRLLDYTWNYPIHFGRMGARKMIKNFPKSLPFLDRSFQLYKKAYGVVSQDGISVIKAQAGKEMADRIEAYCKRSREFGEEWAVKPLDLFAYLPQANWLECFKPNEDVIFGYVTSAIYPMLTRDVPLVGVEIGTIRDIPFEGTAYGRVVAMMYRESDHVLITNPDNKIAADKLGFESYSFCPHPVDEDIYKPLPDDELERDESAPVKIFAPARQNWKEKANDKMYRALAEVLKRGGNAELLIPEWGQDMKESRALVKSLGIEDHVKWLAPQSEGRLIQSYKECDIVMDQFVHGVFGLISPKAMSCGRPVITSYKSELNDWCFGEAPPLRPATEQEEVIEQLDQMVRNPELRRSVGEASREWIIKYHSKAAVNRALQEAGEIATRRHQEKKAAAAS